MSRSWMLADCGCSEIVGIANVYRSDSGWDSPYDWADWETGRAFDICGHKGSRVLLVVIDDFEEDIGFRTEIERARRSVPADAFVDRPYRGRDCEGCGRRGPDDRVYTGWKFSKRRLAWCPDCTKPPAPSFTADGPRCGYPTTSEGKSKAQAGRPCRARVHRTGDLCPAHCDIARRRV